MHLKPYYEHAGITIYHGDCREILPFLFGPDPRCADCEFLRSEHEGSGEDYRLMIERGMCGNFALEECDLLLTDPPYGSGLAVDFAERFKTKAGKWWNKSDRSGQVRHVPIVGDDRPFDPADLFAIPANVRVLWGGNWYASRLPDSGGWWIWDKRNGKRDVTAADWPMSEAELAWTNVGKGVRVFRYTWFGLIRDGDHGEHYHPTQKPTELMRWCIEKSKTDGLIVDPYMGSGTTLSAAKSLQREAIGIEIEEKYCEIAAKRMSQEVINFPANSNDEELGRAPVVTSSGDGS